MPEAEPGQLQMLPEPQTDFVFRVSDGGLGLVLLAIAAFALAVFWWWWRRRRHRR